ncbi:MAG TPA: DUF6636 domain-containing protein [Actinomycetota bacterium]|nr:DUF6636 domain-containing protein [Actinomycetota bacterium]
MKRRVVYIVLIGLIASTAIVASAGAAMHRRKFQMPSHNIGCAFYAHSLRCDIRSGLNPEPQRRCNGDWTGVYVDADGKAGAVCAGDTAYDSHARELAYGRKWKRQGIVCHSRETGLRCRNHRGHGFFLSRERWNTF